MKSNYLMTPVALAVMSVLASGCSTIGDNTREEQLNQREALLNEKEIALAEKEKQMAEVVNAAEENPVETVPTSSKIQASDLLPPGANPGECYARVWQPASYKNVSEQVLVQEESEKVITTPAQYQWATKTVTVSPATKKLVVSPTIYGQENVKVKVSDEQTLWRRTLSPESSVIDDAVVEFAQAHSSEEIKNTRPGECFHEHQLPPTYKTVEEKVLVKDAYDVVETIPAKYKTVEKTVVLEEASTKLVEVPATYKTVQEKILVKPATTVWKKGTGPIQRIDESTGEIMCLVEVPAEYKTVEKQVIDRPATTKKVKIPAVTEVIKIRELVEPEKEVRKTIPAEYKMVSKKVLASEGEFVWHNIHSMELSRKTRTGRQICLVHEPARYKTITKQIVKTPAATKEVAVPAVTKTIKVKNMVAEPKEQRIKIPAVYKTVERQELVSDGHMEWRSILCETNMTRDRITKIQEALREKGYNPGKIDGVVGSQTIAAMNEFQRDNNLPVDKYLNVESVRALGVAEK